MAKESMKARQRKRESMVARYAEKRANTIYGVLGIKVWLFNCRVNLLRCSKLSIYTVIENSIKVKCSYNFH
jgi:ribosomal protein S3